MGLSKRLRAYAEKDGRGYPDWAVRYLPVLRRWRTRNLGAMRVLEVGANENGLARFAHARVVAVDLSPAHLAAARQGQDVLAVAADIAALPFADGAFGAVACIDTMEHLPPSVRPLAAAELLRVLARDGVAVVAFPSGAAAAQAEHRVQTAYRALTGRTIPWLEQHAEHGLPNAGALAEVFRHHAQGTRVVTLGGNASLWLWEWMWRVLMCNWPGRGNAMFQVLLRWLTPLLSRCHKRPCYRAVIWID